jgi:hypothetical protein
LSYALSGYFYRLTIVLFVLPDAIYNFLNPLRKLQVISLPTQFYNAMLVLP